MQNGWWTLDSIATSVNQKSYNFNAVAGERIRVVLFWTSHTANVSNPPYTDDLHSNLDLYIAAPTGAIINQSVRTADNFEIVEFTAGSSGTHQIQVRRGPASLNEPVNDNESFGVAWSRSGTFLPDIRSSSSGWNSTIYVRNDDAQPKTVTVSLVNPNGTLWGSFSQYLSANAVWPFVVNIGPWQGSAVVDGSENLSASVVNKRSPSPFSSGAYLGISTGKLSNPVYVPLAMHNLTSASGVANSELVIQNAGGVAVNLSIQLLASSGSPGPASLVKSVNNLAAGAAFLYDLTTEVALTNGWFGSAVISAGTGAKLAVTSNLKSGANTIQAFNGFAAENLGTTWAVPLFTARLANGLNTPVTVQNLSGGQINANGIQLKCVKDLASPGTNFSIYNSAALPNNGSYSFNPYTDTSIPAGWFGACQVIASGNVVAFVQMRNIGGTGNSDNAAAYEAMRGNGVGKVAIFPLIQKRLVDGSATAITIQNLSANTAHLTFYYVANSSNALNFTVGPCAIAGNASVIHNHRVTDPNTTNCPLTNPTMPDSWQGSLIVTSSDQPIDGFIQLTNINNLAGDAFMAHNANTSP